MNYRPVYEHQGSTLSADSGYIYSDKLGQQFFDAFGKVIITQPSGTVIYADKLHYAAETQLATLTDNVRMVDNDAVLTTNHLDYNMKNSIGTYTEGGRIINATDTITSRNAYYFDNTKDAYFRYDVIVRTPNVQIYTDTMRYNSAAKMTYFYGPTNIRGHNNENLYTERGQYNTDTQQAWFDDNNLYTEGSRFLRGDSLYYDGQSGNGRAVNNVVFIDTTDQFFAYGGIGVYHRDNESITMTRQPLVVTITRNKTEPTDSLQNSTTGTDSPATDSLPSGKLTPDSIQAGSQYPEHPAVDSIYMTADTLFSQVIPLHDYVAIQFDLDREGGALLSAESEPDFTIADNSGQQGDFYSDPADSLPDLPDQSARQLTDSLATLPDTLANTGLPAETDQAILETHRKRIAGAPADSNSSAQQEQLAADSVLRAQAPIPTGSEADSLLAGAIAATAHTPADSIPSDTITTDTATTRIIKAYHNVRLYKSDLQAVADSLYYGYPDSMMRFFGRPMIWAQGSQLTADTIFMQIRHEQLDNMLMVHNAFLVNTQLDSSKYNQIKGRRITGFFTDNQLERLFIDGNAESIYYNVDEEKQAFTDMYHNRSSRIKITLDSNAISQFIPISGVDGKVYPIRLVPREAEILEGFIWKPGDRPTSKQDLLTRRRAVAEPESAAGDTQQPETTEPRAAEPAVEPEPSGTPAELSDPPPNNPT